MELEEMKKKAKLRFEEARYKAERCKEALRIWATEYPAEAASLVVGALTFVGGATIKGIDSANKKKKAKKEWEEEECRQWDPRTGMYLYTKKPLRNGPFLFSRHYILLI